MSRSNATAKTKPVPRVPAVRQLRWLVGALVVLLAITAWGFASYSPSTPGKEVSYDAGLARAEAKQVKAADFFDQDERMVLTIADGTKEWVGYPTSGPEIGTLISTMRAGGANVVFHQQWGKRTMLLALQSLLPILLLATAFGIWMVGRGSGSQIKDIFAFSGARAEQIDHDDNPTRFRDVAGLAEPVVELREVRDYLADPTRFARMGALPPKGVLLYGPPGTGKTLLARALAGEAGVPFYALSGSEFVESLVGVGAARVRDVFRKARDTAPCIVFVDELDAAGRKRGAGIGGGHDEREQTLNQLLTEMDGFEPTAGVVVVAATNRPDILDPALLRPGRFDLHIGVDVPDVDGRLAILSLHAAKRPLDPAVDLHEVARRTPGFTGADLANVVNEGARLAVRRRASAISLEDLLEGAERVESGPQRKGHLLTEGEKRRLAYHEAGHAIVARKVLLPAEVDKVSIVARGRESAGHSTLLKTDRVILTRDELLAEMAVVMAGRAAEILVEGQASTASEADIERATNLARQFAGRHGFASEVGPVRVVQADAEVFLGRDYLAAQHVSADTMSTLDAAVRRLTEEAEATALGVVREYRKCLDAVARALIERETISGEELTDLLGQPKGRYSPLAAGSGSSATSASQSTRSASDQRRSRS